MKKKIFIVSKIYDTEKMTDNDIRISSTGRHRQADWRKPS